MAADTSEKQYVTPMLKNGTHIKNLSLPKLYGLNSLDQIDSRRHWRGEIP